MDIGLRCVNHYSQARMIIFLCVSCLLSGLVIAQDMTDLYYTIEEETGVKVVIGNIARDSGLFQSTGPDFGLLSFKTFTEGNTFVQYIDVDESIGVLRTAKNLDREELCHKELVCKRNLEIGVYKLSSLVKVVRVFITVTDINDNDPVFPNQVVNLQVPENQEVNHALFTSVATDADAVGPNSTLSYKLARPNALFEISTIRPTGGLEDVVITIKKSLDREDKKIYPLTVIASDYGEPRRSGTVLINIQVTDMNDNPPVFGRSNYTVNVLENVNINDPILIITASDRDTGPNADLIYELSSQVSQDIRQMFTVQPKTGQIYARRMLDFEDRSLYQFYITVRDSGSAPKVSFAYVTIRLIDVNDNPPEINVNQGPRGDVVIENGSVGKFLAHIKVTDADSGEGGRVTCSISDDHFDLQPFQDASLGIYQIKLKKALDREIASSVDVTVLCRDQGNPSLSAFQSFEVKVKDVNDNAPTFIESSLFGTVLENGENDEFVMEVIADDMDAGDNARLAYRFTSFEDVDLFTINEDTGVIKAVSPLDRELKSEYKLEVTAVDRGATRLSASATVTIMVLDENDNPPRFTQQAFFASIVENLSKGSPVGDVTAYDPDSKENARFQYSILRGMKDGKHFHIDPNTGVITSKEPFDREDKSLYKFQVRVADPSVSNYYDTANVTVTITDDNDHAPFIIKPKPAERVFYCHFNLTIGTVITTIEAIDEDDPTLVEFSFTINKADPDPKKPLFSIDANSGKLRLARQIRPEDVSLHKLKISVRDGTTADSQTTLVDVSAVVEPGSEAEMKAFQDSNRAGSQANMVIIIIIIAVTIILAIVIVAVICLIRRVDKKRHPPRRSENGIVMDSKLYHAAQWVSSVSIPNELGPEDATKATLEVPGAAEKKKKKEVSFSLDEDVVESPDTSGSMGSVFSPSPHTVQVDTSNSSRPHHKMGPREIVVGGAGGAGGAGNPRRSGNGEGFILLNGMASPDFSQHLYEPRTSSTDAPDERQYIEVSRPGEDRYSDASSGDTGTSDSGRGGSEDESHAHASGENDPRVKFSSRNSSSSGVGSFRGSDSDKPHHYGHHQQQQQQQRHPQQQYTTDTEHIPGSPTPMLSEEVETNHQQQQQQQQAYLTPAYRPTAGSLRSLTASPSPSPSHLKYCDSTRVGSVNNIHGGNGSNGNAMNSNNSNSSLPLTHNNARVTLSMNDCEGPYRVKKAEQHQQLLKTFSSPHTSTNSPNHLPSSSHPAWRRAHGLDTSWRSAPPGFREEDDNTTTSGSYVINPDELVEEAPYNPDIMV